MSKEFGRFKAILYWSEPADWESQLIVAKRRNLPPDGIGCFVGFTRSAPNFFRSNLTIALS
jgi:hypothetical protein